MFWRAGPRAKSEKGRIILKIADQMDRKLRDAFDPGELTIIDESESHRGHGGWREGGETHFKIVIRAPGFKPMSRIQRHRAVVAALTPELVDRIHALSMDISG